MEDIDMDIDFDEPIEATVRSPSPATDWLALLTSRLGSAP